MTTVERALNSIGKKCFVDYYDDFRDCFDKAALARKLLATNGRATSITAQMTRVNYAKWIFENNREREALRIIVASDRLDEATKTKASVLLTEL